MRFVLLAAMCGLIGCSQPAPSVVPKHADAHQDPHDVAITKADVKMPSTFKELVTCVEEYNGQIKAAIESGKPETGHRALDELDYVLADTMALAQKSVAEDRLGSVNEERQAIRNAFLEIHQSIDAKETPDYASKEPAIQAAIATIKDCSDRAPVSKTRTSFLQ